MYKSSLIEPQTDQKALIKVSQKLLPWWVVDDKNLLKLQTEEDPKSYLDSYYLFLLDEISVSSDCDDIPKFINERFQNVLAAANHAKLSVALVVSRKKGNHKVFLGLKSDKTKENNPAFFESILNGILSGKKITFQETINISYLADGYQYGGMLTGVPILKKDDEKQKFNLSSVVRSLYGKEYLFAIISKPITETEKQNAFSELIQVRDVLHSLAKQTVGEEKGFSQSLSKTDTFTNGYSDTTVQTEGKTRTIGHNVFAGLYSHNRSKTETNSISRGKVQTNSVSQGKAETVSEQQSRSLSVEQQNGYALELEKIAEQYIERIIQGFGSGYWETAITFATQDEIASDILAGTFAAELSKPSDKLLPPPRIYLDTLDGKTLFIPKNNSSNSLFPKQLSSYITSEELSLISSPPVESIPGYEIQTMPPLALTDSGTKSNMILGAITDHGNPIQDTYLYLSKGDLNKHLFVCGLTGSGKTTTIKHILKDLILNEGTPFLVLESAKRDYRQLLVDDVFKNQLNIFTIGDATVSPIRFNPFYIQAGVHPLVHIDYLKAIFNASFSLYGPMPSIVEKCLHAIYINKGWDLTLGIHPNFVDCNGNYDEGRYQFEEHFYCFPILTELKSEVDRYIKEELDYKGELRDNIRTAIIVRLESLCVGAKGLMFNTHSFFSIERLLSKNTILEMESLADDDDKAFFVGLILVLISEYRQKENPAVNPGVGNKGLQHFMVIEEAHRLLKNVETERATEMMGNPKGKAVDVFCNILSEMRSLGQGVAVVEQIPSKISPDVIKNSNMKIVHRLVSKDDQSLLAGSLSIDEYDALYLNRLKTGHALCHKEGMGRPVECTVLNNINTHAISDHKVKRLMLSSLDETVHDYQVYQLDSLLGDQGKELVIKLFNSLLLLQDEEPKKLINIAEDEIQQLLTLKNTQYRVNDAFFPNYVVLQVMMLLNKGIYCRNNQMPTNLKAAIFHVVDVPTKEMKAALIKTLNILWNPISARFFIKSIIGNLVIQYLNKKDVAITLLEIENSVSSFLLLRDERIVSNISKEVQSKLERNYA